MKKAVCLLSGGLDSTTALYAARRDGYEVVALTVRYGQRHVRETHCARQLTRELGVRHYETSIDLPWGGSSLVDMSLALPLGRRPEQMGRGIPNTYVPARNSVFLSLAVSCAEAEGAEAVYIGANALDYSGYPDCRQEYLDAFQEAMARGTQAGAEGKRIEIKAPLLAMTKKEIVEFGRSLDVSFEKTWSCYQGAERPCGACDSCGLRAKGFEEAGMEDPLLVAARKGVSSR